jgi:hypothetical protein
MIADNTEYIAKARQEIDPNKFYTPREISENGWIRRPSNRGGKNNTSYDLILKLIKIKKLNANNFGMGEKNPYYRIKGSDLLDYLSAF